MDRAGLRRKLLKAQADASDIVLLFGDESEALTHPSLAHARAKKGADLRVPAPGQAAKVAMLGALDWARRELVVSTSGAKRSADFIAFLEEIDERYGPELGVAMKPIILVLDNGPIHTSKATRAKRRVRRLKRESIGSQSSGSRNTPLNSTTSKKFGATSSGIISLT